MCACVCYYLNEPLDVVEMVGALAGLVQTERDVVGQDGEQVDGVERALEELALARRRPQPQHVLEREPGDARRLQVGQMLVVGQLSFVVAALQARQGVEGQADRRRHDEQDRDGRQNLHARRTTTRGVVGRRRGGTASPTSFLGLHPRQPHRLHYTHAVQQYLLVLGLHVQGGPKSGPQTRGQNSAKSEPI